MKRQFTIPPEQEKAAMALFNDAIPYYWETADKYPPILKLLLSINGYGSAHAACVDIANHQLATKKLKLEANRALISVQNFVELM